MDNLLTVYARNCSVRRIDRTLSASFLDKNHRLGSTGGRYHYGLFVARSTSSNEVHLSEGELVAVAVFSNARRWKRTLTSDGVSREIVHSSYEWIRYASLQSLRVVGGMGKLLEAFINEVRPDDVMSYADADYPDSGQSYLKLGFRSEGECSRAGRTNIKYRLLLRSQSFPEENAGQSHTHSPSIGHNEAV